MSNYTILIDGDIFLYQCGFATNHEPQYVALKTVMTSLNNATNACLEQLQIAGHDVQDFEVEVFLTGPDNFRDYVGSMQRYKGNRRDVERPVHYAAMKEHMLKNGAILSNGEEADDLLGIRQTELLQSGESIPVLMSVDKDLNMIPGLHFNSRTWELYEVDEDDGAQAFLGQLLSGDTTDNIPGLFRVSGIKANAAIKREALKRGDIWDVITTYKEALIRTGAFPEDVDDTQALQLSADIVSEIGHLLWIRRGEDSQFLDIFDRVRDGCVLRDIQYVMENPIGNAKETESTTD